MQLLQQRNKQLKETHQKLPSIYLKNLKKKTDFSNEIVWSKNRSWIFKRNPGYSLDILKASGTIRAIPAKSQNFMKICNLWYIKKMSVT